MTTWQPCRHIIRTCSRTEVSTCRDQDWVFLGVASRSYAANRPLIPSPA